MKTKTISKHRQSTAERKKWYQKRMREIKATPAMRKMHKHLLKHGGVQVVPQPEKDMTAIALVESGQLAITTNPRKVRLARGEPCRCHTNASVLWLTSDNYTIHTGYALLNDGEWRQHSWLVRDDGMIIETTIKRTAYFGVELNADEAIRFALENTAHFHPRNIPKLTAEKLKLMDRLVKTLDATLALAS